MSSSGPFKHSPLSFNSVRNSPFRRQSSPGSPPAAIRPTTPTSSPGKPHTPIQSPSKLNQTYTAEEDEETVTNKNEKLGASPRFREPPPSPTRGSEARGSPSSTMRPRSPRPMAVNNDALSRLPPALLRDMREAFQVLDRDNDGNVNRDDVADVLSNLGLDPSPSTLSRYFPAGSQTMNLPTFLNTLSTLLAPFSSERELLNAFAAFDDDDSGQIDVSELRDALLHTNPDAGERPLSEKEIDQVLQGFTSKRAFGGKGKSSGFNGTKRGEVFNYQDFVSSILGASDQANGKEGRVAANA
ncbi:hypothetical protein VTN49DRAFT_4576 [Thermomyces lanuginosus]|uniref:uncharacterized protein n=1 Tax=Thermomyces lanuginosus TaxID=5541 RepID=UPI00374301E4